MAERTTKTGIAISSVDENYTAPANATPEEATKARLAAAMREGVKREKGRQEPARIAALAAQTQAHKAELDRTGKIVSRAAHRDGMLQGIILGMLCAIALAFSTWFVLREVVITNVNVARTPQAAVPVLQDEGNAPVTYERNPREPGDAH